MEYLQRLFVQLFGSSANNNENCRGPYKIVAFGNVLIDRTAKLPDTAIIERYNLPLNSKGELDNATLSKIAAEACQSICETNPGGSSLNAVRILKRLGREAMFFGAVGVDENAEELKRMLEDHKVTARLETVDDAPTGQCIALITDDNATLYADIGASAKFSTKFLIEAEKAASVGQPFLRPPERRQIILIEGFFIPHREAVCQHIREQYIRGNRRLAINLSAPYIVRDCFTTLIDLVQAAFFIFGNTDEFEALQEQMTCETLEQMADQLLSYGAKVLIITKGSEGIQLISNFKGENCPPGPTTYQSFKAPRVETVVDTTGAGDSFMAAFLHAWLERRQLSECVRIAADVAAKVVTQVGCNLP